jgi:hypothetical protein
MTIGLDTGWSQSRDQPKGRYDDWHEIT